ncbi:MAG: Gfo/Idh/MocA family oxidoreductase [Pirellulales bacterium]|nr:Gfo/Idh/MocA family oxidoreductase [Pirellulales bacterium]
MEIDNAICGELSVGVIGARRVRHGIGPFVAAHLSKLGAHVAAVAGTSHSSVAAAQENLHQMAGIAPQGYTSVEEMFAEEALDAVAICSPDTVHLEQLQLALEAGVHVLCEKPLVFDGRTNPADTVRPLVEAFADKGLALVVNEQWPYTLPAFDLVHPNVHQAGVPPQEFRMLLCPGATGADMIPNSMPHVLSMLGALHGDADPSSVHVRDIEVSSKGRDSRGDVDAATVSFVYCGDKAENSQPCVTNVSVELRFMAAPPRPARYAIDGFGVERVIREPGYRMSLEPWSLNADAGKRNQTTASFSQSATPLADPLPQLLADFTRQCASTSHKPNMAAVANLQALWHIYETVRRHPEFGQASH